MTATEKNRGNGREIVSNPIVSVSDPKGFNMKILNARIEQYRMTREANEKTIFFDRGIPDILAYMDFFRQTYDSVFNTACETMKYDLVFLMPPWKEIHISDDERYESFEESVGIYHCIKRIYENFSFNPIIVPKRSIVDRVEFILDQINAS